MHHIYQIYSKSTGYTYIGQSKEVEKRWRAHRTDLVGNKHHNIHLQRIASKYGIEDLLFELINMCDTQQEANEQEQIWIDTFRHSNISINLSGDTNVHALSQETKDKIRKAHLGRRKTEDQRKKMSTVFKGRIFSEEHKRNLSKAHPRLPTRSGIPHSKEYKIKSSRSHGFNPAYVIDPGGKIHLVENLRDFCKEHNLLSQNLGLVIRGLRNHHRGWRKGDTLEM